MRKDIPLSAPISDDLRASLRTASRRDVLRALAGTSLLPFAALLGCGGTGGDSSQDLGGGGATDLSGGSTDMSGSWASGGTAAMTAKASYPNPFTAALGTCALVAVTTEGPCTTTTDLARSDVSDAWAGLPVRLALKLVDASCNPVIGKTVKIWHTNLEGSYSGQTPNNNMCLKQQAYAAANFFRGAQVSGADGTVYFDTCFPGWYRGRAVHVHFQVKDSNQSYRVSQLFFPEDITAAIFTSHSDYKGAGQPDTTFANDNVLAAVPSAQRDRHILTVARMSDGAMLASKVVTVL